MQLFTATVLIFLTARADWKLTKGFGLTLTVGMISSSRRLLLTSSLV
jgi:hypothetical protein